MTLIGEWAGEWVGERESVLDWGEGDLIWVDFLPYKELIGIVSDGSVDTSTDPSTVSLSANSPSTAFLCSSASSFEGSSCRWVCFSYSEGSYLYLIVNLGFLGAGSSGAVSSNAFAGFLANSFMFTDFFSFNGWATDYPEEAAFAFFTFSLTGVRVMSSSTGGGKVSSSSIITLSTIW